jgi:catechol 2,3-dioxygenase-like lactoylglutathione lyase family enzyme
LPRAISPFAKVQPVSREHRPLDLQLQGFHVCIRVADIELSQRFYSALGFEALPGLCHQDDTVIWRYFRRPGSDIFLELLHYRLPPDPVRRPPARSDLTGLNHIGFHVDDLDAVAARLRVLGANIAEQGCRQGYRYLFATGPDGEYLGFAELERR